MQMLKAPPRQGISFWSALSIPGVLPYAGCLFFAKLVAYVFLYWLPFYLQTRPIGRVELSAKQAGDFSALFDVGGLFGGVVAGLLSDLTGASAMVSTGFITCTLPALYAFRTLGTGSFGASGALMMICGFVINGPYALITTAVAADLGNHDSVQGNERALSTVTAIIDGSGSVGAAVGPLLVGYLVEGARGFDDVFSMLYVATAAAAVLLVRLVSREVWTQRLNSYALGTPGSVL